MIIIHHYITTKTVNNIVFFDKEKNTEAVKSAIYFGRKIKWFNLVAFVIMPDHLHLIIVPDQKNISQAMDSIKSYSSKEINKINNSGRKVWQSSFRDFTIYTETQLLDKITYIHNNPLRKGLVSDPSIYNFSSANPKYETDIQLVL